MRTNVKLTHKDFERKLGLKYRTEDELTEEEQKDIQASVEPVKAAMDEVIKSKPYEPFGVPGIIDTTKYDGNLSQAYEKK
jgi:hypothetical protein